MTTTQLTPEHAAIQARIEAEIAEHIAAVRDVEARCKAAFLPLLKKHGITRVDITYDGGGDEGMMGDITAYRGDVVCELPSVLCDHYAVDYGGNVRSSALPLEDALSAFAENAVCDHHGGWENGEGAHGGIVIDVASGRVTITHNARFIDYDTTETEL
ncbi:MULTISPECIES: DUF6878 family protein [Sphingomonadaceae]|uniref:DUF6878 family protein n=1 Tax=Sphingomonadales TaxID=204457 RepID=UPI00083072EF|nr:DUF6878 family protein [Sphingopyxis granuli]MCF8710410.1 hypothetical protein [Rhizorhapis sp. SPR117]SCW96029.1 hypothetical protein SAMN02927924_04805 [Sphingobium faniae]